MCSSIPINITASSLTVGNKDLTMTITNNSGATLTITRIYVAWIKDKSNQSLDSLTLAGSTIMGTPATTPPSDFPASALTGTLTIADGASSDLVATWQTPLASGANFWISVTLDTTPNCQVMASTTIP